MPKLEHISEDFGQASVKAQYPCIEVLSPTDAVALVITGLRSGAVPIVIRSEGAAHLVGSCAASVLEVNKLLRLSPLMVHAGPKSSYKITTVDELFTKGGCLWTL